mgnify:CR=1 FL=1
MEDKIIKNNYGVYFIFFVGLLLVVIFLFDDYKISKKMENESKDNFYIEMSGTVSGISQNRGTIILKLRNNSVHNKYYFGSTRNYNLNPKDLHEFVQPGDSVFKSSNSNELFVIKNNKRYRFIIDKSINRSDE